MNVDMKRWLNNVCGPTTHIAHWIEAFNVPCYLCLNKTLNRYVCSTTGDFHQCEDALCSRASNL